jgi:WD40 repeat protein
LEETAPVSGRGFEWYYWQRQLHQELKTLRGHTGSILAVAYSPNDDRIVTGSADFTARVWDAASGRELLTLRGHTNVVRSVAFSPDGQRILTGGWDGTAMLWDADTGKKCMHFRANKLQFSRWLSPDGRRIVTEAGIRRPKCGTRPAAKNYSCSKGTAVSSGPWPFPGRRTDCHRQLGSDGEGGQPRQPLTFSGHDKPSFLAFSPDGERIVSGSRV